ncbi:MAG: 50S ribosomal protein L10 [Bifidobacteriaceae bacterium]|jgi:large subunit ribosomal protein L10|nr:50S ribosomal protein L10 [Bifidobacteriaceae bacterium]
MARPEKVAAVAELEDKFRQSNAAIVTEYRGLTVPQLRELRDAIRSEATYAVAKNTLASIAVREVGIEGLEAALQGPTAIAFVTGDPVATAKAMRGFAKTNPNLVVKAGVLDGHAITAAEVIHLADLDTREVTLAKIAGVVKASLYKAANMFTQPASKAVRTIDALRAKQETAA